LVRCQALRHSKALFILPSINCGCLSQQGSCRTSKALLKVGWLRPSFVQRPISAQQVRTASLQFGLPPQTLPTVVKAVGSNVSWVSSKNETKIGPACFHGCQRFHSLHKTRSDNRPFCVSFWKWSSRPSPEVVRLFGSGLGRFVSATRVRSFMNY